MTAAAATSTTTPASGTSCIGYACDRERRGCEDEGGNEGSAHGVLHGREPASGSGVAGKVPGDHESAGTRRILLPDEHRLKRTAGPAR